MQLFGILCSIGAALFWAMAVIMFKKSGDTLSPTALNLFKGVVTLMLLLPTLWLADVSLFPPHPATHWLRFGLSGLLGITLADNFFSWPSNAWVPGCGPWWTAFTCPW
ncbi:EamA family transporter [Desulfosarcina cetonica]|uniref:EamA family transporter n=1 Tax=Desulfosarcina cetonica TaxID=90730 RepID=UPI0006D09EA6|nr:EamA family transporter [Desulfosarcina cetonica]